MSPVSSPQAVGRRKPEDTAAGCRANAAHDMECAAAASGDHMRRRMEHSAASWIARAELLERLAAANHLRTAAHSARGA